LVIAVVGIGLDGQQGLSRTVQELIEQATVLAGSKRHLGYFADHPAKKLNLANLQTGIEAIAQLKLDNHSVVILTSGDPLFFGLGRLLLEKFKPEEIEFYPENALARC
jgi:precorrin-6Y C5,15-methyltransferase (decarboxylating)